MNQKLKMKSQFKIFQFNMIIKTNPFFYQNLVKKLKKYNKFKKVVL